MDEAKLFDEFRNTVETALAPLREKMAAEEEKHGEALAETKAEWDKVNGRLDEFEVQLQKAALETQQEKTGKSEQEKAFFEWVAKGDAVPVETKAQLQIGDDTAGGFLAPEEFIQEILKGVIEYSPMRQVARVTSTVATSVKIPKRTGVFAATWTASAASRTETTGLTYGLEEIPTHELYALADVENQLVEDAVFNIESELAGEFSEQFGVAEGAAFVNGTGVGRPEGFLQSAQVTTINTATNDVFVAADLIDLYFSIKTDYARNSAFLLNRGIIKAIRKFQDVQGNYLWQAGLSGLAPATILDRPYVEVPDMASAVADQAKIVAFGDWRRAYRIVDRVMMTVQRDPYTQNTVGATRFIARKRTGGQLVVSEAIKVLNVA